MSSAEHSCHQTFRLGDTSDPQDRSGKGGVYEAYKARIADRIEGTCQWLLSLESFKQWRDKDSGVFLLKADPGCGKSVLSKYLIDHGLHRLADHSSGPVSICYFFFVEQIQPDINQALCAFLHQLFFYRPILIRHAMKTWQENGATLCNIDGKLWEICRNAIPDEDAGQVIWLVDALDECSLAACKSLTQYLSDHFCSDRPRKDKFKVLLTTRPYEHIVSGFRILQQHPGFCAVPDETNAEEEQPHAVTEKISEEIKVVIKHQVQQLGQTRNL